MKENMILEKVLIYLKESGYTVEIDDLSYNGIRENSPLFEGTGTKPMHIINFNLEAIKGNPLTSNIYTVAMDVKTNDLEYIIGKNIFEKISQ
nr:hypothetical protein [uncultured Flavobacterium sp.]